MITPGFFNFYNAHRAMVATQNALSTVSHNISNANTPGYTRQRVDVSAYNSYAMPTKYQVSMGGQIGQGPQVDQILRIRDQFLDSQFRFENGLSGMNTQMSNVLQQIEGILGEPSTNGINNAIQKFFDSAQEMSLHPESLAVRSDFVQQAQDMVTVFQQQALQLSDARRQLVGDPAISGSIGTSQLGVQVLRVNEILTNVAKLNKNIIQIQSAGSNANDLMDQRDLLLDELSGLVDINVTSYDSGLIDLSIAGQIMVRGTDQVNSLEAVANVGPAPTPDDVPTLVRTVVNPVVLNDGAGAEFSAGAIKGILDMGGNGSAVTTIRGVQGQLDNLFTEIATRINALQTAGMDGYGNAAPPAIFVLNPLLNAGQALDIYHYQVNSTISTDPRLVAAAVNDPLAPGGYAGAGDGRNALAMANLKDTVVGALGGTFIDYFNGTISNVGIDSRSYQDRTSAQETLVNSLDGRRQSVSGVNVDEETIDLLRYQRAFEATSKTIQIFDEVIQTILNMV